MCTLRDTVVFVAGAEFFHTLSHVVLHYIMVFPMTFTMHAKVFELTSSLNNLAIAVNALITIVLLLWAMRLTKKQERS
jgi:hypothetical protein